MELDRYVSSIVESLETIQETPEGARLLRGVAKTKPLSRRPGDSLPDLSGFFGTNGSESSVTVVLRSSSNGRNTTGALDIGTNGQLNGFGLAH